MSDSEVLEVRFHCNGDFVIDGSKVKYCNGDWGLSHVDKDKLSIPELEGHLLDHTTFQRCIRMYWLPFGAEVSSGMKLLVDDKSCLDMVNELGAARAVDIYTEPIEIDANEEIETQYEDEDVFALFRDDNIMDLDAPTHLVAKSNEQIGEKIWKILKSCIWRLQPVLRMFRMNKRERHMKNQIALVM